MTDMFSGSVARYDLLPWCQALAHHVWQKKRNNLEKTRNACLFFTLFISQYFTKEWDSNSSQPFLFNISYSWTRLTHKGLNKRMIWLIITFFFHFISFNFFIYNNAEKSQKTLLRFLRLVFLNNFFWDFSSFT